METHLHPLGKFKLQYFAFLLLFFALLTVLLPFSRSHILPRLHNTPSSSAGAGSGVFHQYRFARRREEDRMAQMTEERAEALKER